MALVSGAAAAADPRPPLHVFVLAQDGSRRSYDEAVAVACIQGVVNRDSPDLYVLSKGDEHPRFWLDVLSSGGRWLQGRPLEPVADIDALVTGSVVTGSVVTGGATGQFVGRVTDPELATPTLSE